LDRDRVVIADLDDRLPDIERGGDLVLAVGQLHTAGDVVELGGRGGRQHDFRVGVGFEGFGELCRFLVGDHKGFPEFTHFGGNLRNVRDAGGILSFFVDGEHTFTFIEEKAVAQRLVAVVICKAVFVDGGERQFHQKVLDVGAEAVKFEDNVLWQGSGQAKAVVGGEDVTCHAQQTV